MEWTPSTKYVMRTHSLGNMKKRKRWLAGAEHRIPYGLLAASSPPSQSLHCLLELSCSTSYRTHITYQCFFLLNPNAQWGHNATANEDKSARGWLGYLRRAGRRGWASYAALLLSVLARRSRGGDKTPRVGPGSCFALGTLDFEQGGGEQRNAQGTSPGTVSLLGGVRIDGPIGGELGLFQISKIK